MWTHMLNGPFVLLPAIAHSHLFQSCHFYINCTYVSIIIYVYMFVVKCSPISREKIKNHHHHLIDVEY